MKPHNLNTLLIKTYSRIAEDPAFKHLPSALSYCFSAQRQTNGHYFSLSSGPTGGESVGHCFFARLWGEFPVLRLGAQNILSGRSYYRFRHGM